MDDAGRSTVSWRALPSAFLVGVALAGRLPAQPPAAKPSISVQDLEKHTRYFDIVDGRLVGDGATFLVAEFRRSQYVLFGEFHASPLISEFTSASIPVLHDAGFRTLGLEVGPFSAERLTEMSRVPDSTVAALKAYNSVYRRVGTNLQATPRRPFNSPAIPFFDSVEDAQFLAEAGRRHWTLLGLDQESMTAYRPMIERMHAALTPRAHARLAPLRDSVLLLLSAFETSYLLQGGMSTAAAVAVSPEIARYLTAAAETSSRNGEIADAFRATSTIFRHGHDRQYTKQNQSRVDYMRQRLAAEFRQRRFDLRNDKMLLKMGAVHTARGFSVVYQYELGNMLSELAAFHGNRSLHIRFNSRYAMRDGLLVDGINDRAQQRYAPLLQMAKPDRWTVIDLRALQDDVFMRDRFSMDDPFLLQVFQSQDLYIIAPTARAGTPNYVQK